MAQRVVIDVVGNVPGTLIDGHHSATGRTAAVGWSIARIQRHIPEHYAAGPVAAAVDHQTQRVAETIGVAALPGPTRCFGNKRVLGRELVVYDALRIYV